MAKKTAESVAELPRFKVQLAAHTPIEHNGVVIEAENEAEAKAKFCEMNGITDSTCQWTITKE